MFPFGSCVGGSLPMVPVDPRNFAYSAYTQPYSTPVTMPFTPAAYPAGPIAGYGRSHSSGSDWLDQSPMLGNFAKLQLVASRDQRNDWPPNHERQSRYNTEKPTKLGDFNKVFNTFQEGGSPEDRPSCPIIAKGSSRLSSPSPEPGSSSDSDTNSWSETDPRALTPASTPPTSAEHLASPRKGLLFSYYGVRGKPAGNVHEELRTKETKQASLTLGLASHRALDITLAEKHPSITSHGTHLFVDLSNINIGFQNALLAKYGIDRKAHFSPLPHLNLDFLTEVLVRGRPTTKRNIGCSIIPGRTEPQYVKELRDLGYHVDLRDRKRVEGSSVPPSTPRYVEDRVDETLQTRIAESVMEYFQEPGTIVLATGDAKPAPYSDGFFKYAERALKMGWNVEVVSWKGSLSSAWADPKWTAQWEDRFRIIELDQFLDDLLACYL